MASAYLTIIMAALVMGIVFADVGPTAPRPQITVSLVKGGNPYTGSAEVEFVCLEEGPESDSPVGKRVARLACNKGICTNEDWFYKLNPCYAPGQGKFRYKLGEWETYKETGLFDFSRPGQYKVAVDVDTGIYTQEWSDCQDRGALIGAIAKRSLIS
ncbi:MAG: hypothetical protein N3G76_00820 [Candidatus Micrarchaeota archaeon]|nr:hypothetical protein [Candidatus Micrarchaeota archaeon]